MIFQVTVVSAYKKPKDHENVEDILLENIDSSLFVSNMFDSKMKHYVNLISKTPYLCAESLALPEVQNLLKKKFDLAMISMFFSDCYYYFIEQLQVGIMFVN